MIEFVYLYGVLLEVLEEGAPHGVHDALGVPRGPAAVHDEQRVVERYLNKQQVVERHLNKQQVIERYLNNNGWLKGT